MMRNKIVQTILFFLVAALALGCSSHGDHSGGGIETVELEETISAPSATLTQEEQALMTLAKGEHNKALADFPAETR